MEIFINDSILLSKDPASLGVIKCLIAVNGSENNALISFCRHVEIEGSSRDDIATAVSNNHAEDAWISNAIAYINQ
jgi:hypothetical protein